jgi:bifunctional non-homologous end joining protein LigD
MRARPTPTVSTPVTWDEVDAAASGGSLSFEAAEVLQRVADVGDLWEPTATLEQEIPLSG